MPKRDTSVYVQMPCSWHKERDADIIAYLRKQKNRTEAQRWAIRAQMDAHDKRRGRICRGDGGPRHNLLLRSRGKVVAEHIGKSLYRLRILKGWSKSALADKLGVSIPTIMRWENGNTQPADYNFYKIRKLQSGYEDARK